MLLPANFNPEKPLVAGRFFEAFDLTFNPGDPIPVAKIGEEREANQLDFETALRLWLVGYALYAKDALPMPAETLQEEAERVVVMEPTGGGWYLITTPWGPEGEKVQGKDAAEARRAEIVAKGNTKGVTVTGGAGGWYEVNAPWLAEPMKIHGKDAAAVEEAMLIEAGPPAGWVPETEEAKAERLQADADRAAAQAEHDRLAAEAEAAAEAQKEREAEAKRQQDAADTAAAEEAERQRLADAGTAQVEAEQGVQVTEAGSNGYFLISAPWLAEPVKVRGKAAADQRAEELRTAGPPAQGAETFVSGAEGGQSEPPLAGDGPALVAPAESAPGTSEE